MKHYIFILLILILSSCGRSYSKKVVIEDISIETKVEIILEREYMRQKAEILENAAKDSFWIGSVKVAPGVTGKLFNTGTYNRSNDRLSYKVVSA